MAGRRTKGEVVVPTTAMVASAAVFPGETDNSKVRIYRQQESWQKEAWRFYDITPELRFAAGWIGNALSRCLLRPGKVDDSGAIVTSDDPKVTQALAELFAGSDGQAQMLQSLGIHLTIAGEAYLVGRRTETSGTKKVWEVIGVNEISCNGVGTWTIQLDGMTPLNLVKTDTVIRIWRPHPVNRMQADSPVRALLPVLTEIEYLTLNIFAQTTSRLTGAGLMVLPQSVEFPGSADNENKATGLMKLLGTTMSKAIGDPGSAASKVPILVLVPDEAVDKIKDPISFWSEMDSACVETRKSALARFGTGMDLPPEVISGMTAGASSSGGTGTGASHWTSWQIEESAIKLHIEPLLETISNGVVIGYIRPLTGDPKSALVSDTNKLKLQPDRSKEAMELYDRGELNGTALRYYNGVDEEYALTEPERRLYYLRKIAGSSVTPDQVAAALKQLGIEGIPDGMGERPQHPGSNQPLSPSLEDHPSGRTAPEHSLLMLSAVSEPLVLRALERAGNRLRNAGCNPPDVPAQDVYLYAHVNGSASKLLDNAWSMVPQVCAGIADPVAVERVLQAYVENLLTEQVPHSREAMARYLTLVG